MHAAAIDTRVERGCLRSGVCVFAGSRSRVNDPGHHFRSDRSTLAREGTGERLIGPATYLRSVNSANKPHFERAHADEIICLDQIGGNLVVASALNHGTSRLVSELLTFDAGSEFYRYDGHLSDEVVGKEFGELVELLAKRRMLLLAVETDDSQSLRAQLHDDMIHSIEDQQRVIVVNPQNKYRLQQGDALFVISESAPRQI